MDGDSFVFTACKVSRKSVRNDGPSNAWNKNETIEKEEKEENNREIVLHPLYCVLSTRINQSDRYIYLFNDL